MTEPKLPDEPTPRFCDNENLNRLAILGFQLWDDGLDQSATIISECINALHSELTSALALAAEREVEIARLSQHNESWALLVKQSHQLASDAMKDKEAANARAEADAKRLEFMLEHSAFISVSPAREGRGELYQLWEQDEDENLIVISGDGKFFATERAAIDAAMVKP